MVGAGLMIGTSLNHILFVILGTNIGSCVTALLSSFGASTNGKRASIIHLMFNTFGSLIFFVILLLWPTFMEDTFASWFDQPGTQIAMFHTFFNVLFTLLFCPFINVFVKLAEIIIPGQKEVKYETFIDERFLSTPAVAISQVSKEVVRMGKIASQTLNDSIDAFINADKDATPKIQENIKLIDQINQNIIAYLVKISAHGNTKENERYMSVLHHSVNDLYREAEIADNMTKYTRHLVDDNLVFSKHVFEQLGVFKDKLNEQFTNIEAIILDGKYELISVVDSLEDSMDKLRSKLINEHIERLDKGECSPASSGVYINLVSNLERAGDHLHYIAHNIVDMV
jgi:phosphate:Na+ symporter